MRKLWEVLVSWVDVYARARAAHVLCNQGLVKEAQQLMASNISHERK